MDEKVKGERAKGVPPHQVAAGVEEPEKSVPLPVWFFVGIIFIIYGVIILVTGLTEITHPPSTVLASELHPAVWWGAVITALGALFVVTTGPWVSRTRSANG